MPVFRFLFFFYHHKGQPNAFEWPHSSIHLWIWHISIYSVCTRWLPIDVSTASDTNIFYIVQRSKISLIYLWCVRFITLTQAPLPQPGHLIKCKYNFNWSVRAHGAWISVLGAIRILELAAAKNQGIWEAPNREIKWKKMAWKERNSTRLCPFCSCACLLLFGLPTKKLCCCMLLMWRDNQIECNRINGAMKWAGAPMCRFSLHSFRCIS